VEIMAESEIARLRRLIALECESMERGLTGYAITAKHEIIAHKYDRIDAYRKELEQLTDENQAAKIIAEIYMRTVG
jgi:peptidoglycan/xylan/chitin deacetylase (PgdA/CDA1 family)